MNTVSAKIIAAIQESAICFVYHFISGETYLKKLSVQFLNVILTMDNILLKKTNVKTELPFGCQSRPDPSILLVKCVKSFIQDKFWYIKKTEECDIICRNLKDYPKFIIFCLSK